MNEWVSEWDKPIMTRREVVLSLEDRVHQQSLADEGSTWVMGNDWYLSNRTEKEHERQDTATAGPQRGWRPPGPQEAGWLAGKGQNSKTGWKCVQGGNEVHLSPLPTLSPLLTYATRRRRVYSAEKTNHTWNLVMQAKIGMRHPTEMRENKWNPAFWGGATQERER